MGLNCSNVTILFYFFNKFKCWILNYEFFLEIADQIEEIKNYHQLCSMTSVVQMHHQIELNNIGDWIVHLFHFFINLIVEYWTISMEK
jgi:hypothetical protein